MRLVFTSPSRRTQLHRNRQAGVRLVVPAQKLRPTVLVVQATEDAHWNDPPDPVDRSMDWGVFVQRQVSPSFVVIRDVAGDDAAEVSLAEHDEMVETLPPDRADQPFDVSVLPRRSRCRRPITVPMFLRRRVTT